MIRRDFSYNSEIFSVGGVYMHAPQYVSIYLIIIDIATGSHVLSLTLF